MADNDFKYVLQDFSSTQIGSRFTYEEMLMCDRVPFKLQSIIKLYILKEDVSTMEVGAHILGLSENDFSYDVYNKLKLKVRFCEPKKNGGFKVIQKSFSDFKKYQSTKWTDDHVLQDFSVSNLALMSFTI